MSSKEKECPSCAMKIDKDEKICPVCGYEFPRQSPVFIAAVVIMILIFILLVLGRIL
jgi:RNA polymerase subunit RPABC4/transcription elongation factor Spt4